MYGASLGHKFQGRVALGGNRFCNYDTLPIVTLGRRNRRWHIHGMDPDAKAYMDAAWSVPNISAGVPVPNDEWNRKRAWATDLLFKDLKLANLWSKITAFYPFSTFHKSSTAFLWSDSLNGKDPRNVSAAYALLYSGADMIHNAYGIQGASGQLADTQLNIGTALSSFNWHICVYVNTPTMFVANCPISQGSAMSLFVPSGGTIEAIANGITLNPTVGAKQGCIVHTRTSTTNASLYRGGELIANSTTLTATSLPNTTTKLMYYDFTVPSNHFTYPLNFCSIGTGLTDSEAIELCHIVHRFQTRMGRAV
jgi:hypothetical protein